MVAPAGVDENSPQEPVNTALAQAEPAAGGTAEAEPADAGSASAKPGGTTVAETVAAEENGAQASGAKAGGAKASGAKAGGGKAGGAKTSGAQANAAETDAAETDLKGLRLEPQEQKREQAETSRDMSPLALVGIVVGVIVLVGIAAGVLVVVTHGFHKKTVAVTTYRPTPAPVFKLRPGECINSGTGLAVTVLSCGTPHDAEIFATFTLPATSWPGNTVAQKNAGNGCAARLDSYLKPALASVGLAQEYVYPNQAAWQAGERTVVCEVSSPTGKLTGSVGRGS